MLRIATLAILVAASVTPAQALTFGDKSCAEAAVTARIENFDSENVLPDMLEAIWTIRINVHRVHFGPATHGPMTIKFFAHVPRLEGEEKFYLRRHRDGNWWVANCRDR